MSPEERQLLLALKQLTEENNQILHSLRRSQRWQTTWSILKWVLIVGSTLGLYYYLQPFLGALKPALENMVQTYNSISNLLPR